MAFDPSTKTLAQEWTLFEKMVLRDKDYPEEQHSEMRKAFYAGSLATSVLMAELARGIADSSKGAEAIKALGDEAVLGLLKAHGAMLRE